MPVEAPARFPVADCAAGCFGQVEIVETQRHLLVDGANILHAWPELRALLRRGRVAARAELVRQMSAIHDESVVRVTVVFDGSGGELSVVCPGGSATFAVVTTPTGMTADDFIEQWIGRAAAPASCEVATGDVAQGRTVQALGGQWISPADLAAWVGRATGRMSVKLAGRVSENDRNWQRR